MLQAGIVWVNSQSLPFAGTERCALTAQASCTYWAEGRTEALGDLRFVTSLGPTNY